MDQLTAPAPRPISTGRAHPLVGGNVCAARACELMAHLARGALLTYRRPWTVTMNGRRIDVMPNALAVAWIARGFISRVGGSYSITDLGRAALHHEPPATEGER